jgi:uncharacterized membrane protein
VELFPLLVAGLVWFVLHAGVAGSRLRVVLVERFGEKTYRGGFSLASVAALLALIYAYRGTPYQVLWLAPRWLYYVPIVVVPVALMLLVGAFTVPSPTGVGGEKLLSGGEPARGMLRITRHPFLWATVLWSLAHLLVNPDAASLIFFGSLGLTALRGGFDIDAKRRRTHPEGYARFEASTSNVPFGAIAAGRNRLVLRELWLPVALGLALTVAVVALHPRFFGAPAVPDVAI